VSDTFDFAKTSALQKRFHALCGFDNVIVAVSGGSDSLALLHLVYRWQSDIRPPRKLRLIAVTVDHGLRTESKLETRLVREGGRAIGIEHRSVSWRGHKPASAIQDAARIARYRLLAEVTHRLPGRSVVLTGHTRDDQAETLLMRLARGSGPEGLAGIAVHTTTYGCDVSRPILDLSRSALQDYLRSLNIEWLNDPSNEEMAFERVRVRHNGSARYALGLEDAALARTARRMARANTALDHIADQTLCDLTQQNIDLRRYGVFTWCDKCRELPDEIAIRVLRRVIWRLGGQGDLPALGQTEKLFADISAKGFRGATLAGCRCVPKQTGNAIQALFFRESGRAALPVLRLCAPATAIWDRRFRIKFHTSTAEAATIAAVGSNLSILRQEGASTCPEICQIPAEILRTLPGLYVGNELVAAPSLGWGLPGHQIEAEFVVQKLICDRA